MKDPQVAHFGITIGLGPKCLKSCARFRNLWYCDCGASTFYYRHPMDKDGAIMSEEGRKEFADRENQK